MTPDDLDAIRARDAAGQPLREFDSFERAVAALRAFVEETTEDRRALLAEVDRLRGDNAVLSDAMVDRNIDRWDRGVAAERARIRDAVRGLDYGRVDGGDIDGTEGGMFVDDSEWTEVLDRAAVLAAIRGEEA